MLISCNWLKELIDLKDSPSELAERLTMAGLEVEFVRPLDAGFHHVVVGQVLSRDAVPDSGRLTRCEVDTGKRHLQIVCGAPNHKVGDKVVVALPGAVLAAGMEIAATKIRGIPSSGMICSEKELGISEAASGVLILPENAEVGKEAADVLGLRDTILEIDLTPNRADALSHIGIARELSALSGCSLKIPVSKVHGHLPDISSLTSVEVRDSELCPRYTGRVITDVTVRPSPLWMQQRLRAVGVRPVNNIVDVTNYVLMEWGQPLHAFDYDRLEGHRIVVRCAMPGEKMRTLDGMERELDPSMLVICDADKAVAVAGVMGGEDTEVSQATRRIFLESACFQPASIRKTSKKLGLRSESSHRFERGTDIEGMVQALDRAASLIQELAGGRIAKGRMDHYPVKRAAREVTVRYDRVRTLLGVDAGTEEILRIFKGLSFAIIDTDSERAVVRIPAFRVDVTREIDLIEEIARVYGYNRIPSSVPHASVSPGRMTRDQEWAVRARQTLAGLGYSETIHYSFHSPADLDSLGLSEEDPLRAQVRIRNPLSEDQSVLRSTLIPGLLRTLYRNQKRSSTDLKIFEIGRTFAPRDAVLPLEKTRLAGLASGRVRPPGWDVPPRDVDFFDLKGDLQAFLDGMGIRGARFTRQEGIPFLHPGKSAWIACGPARLGFLGELHPSVVTGYEISGPAICFDLDFDLCLQEADEETRYRTVPRFPSVERDIALVLSEETTAGEVEERIRNTEPNLIRETRLFDLYRGKPIPSGKKSLAFSIRFQAEDRTLTDEEVNRIRDRIVKELHREFDATLRE